MQLIMIVILDFHIIKCASAASEGSLFFHNMYSPIFSPLVTKDSLKEEYCSGAFQGITKSMGKTLQKLHLCQAILVAYGEGAGMLLKAMLTKKAGEPVFSSDQVCFSGKETFY